MTQTLLFFCGAGFAVSCMTSHYAYCIPCVLLALLDIYLDVRLIKKKVSDDYGVMNRLANLFALVEDDDYVICESSTRKHILLVISEISVILYTRKAYPFWAKALGEQREKLKQLKPHDEESEEI